MITAERKPLSEIKAMIAPYRKILVVGCGTCVAECAAGGEKEVGLLASALRMDAQRAGRDLDIKEVTLDRQCVYEFIDQLTEFIAQYDAVLSLGCGAGVQAVAEVFPKAIILPALNTTFVGETKEAGLWVEKCRGCGDCKLGFFAAPALRSGWNKSGIAASMKRSLSWGGIAPLKSARMAAYMSDQVAGMDIPEEIIKRMKSVPTDKQRAEGIRIAVETIEALKGMKSVRGVHIMAIEWEEVVPQLVEAAGLTPRPEV